MGIASFSTTGLLGSFQGLVGWLTASAPAHTPQRQVPAMRPAQAWATGCTIHPHPHPQPTRTIHPACSPPAQAAPRYSVRVLRVIETPQSATSAGRMRISGRMADVCAELDRLAALESTPGNNALLQ